MSASRIAARVVEYRENARQAYQQGRYLDASRWSQLAQYWQDRGAATTDVSR